VKRGTREADLAVEAGRNGRRISPDLGVVGSGFCGGGEGAARAAGEGKTKPSKLNSFRYKQPVKLKSSAGENKALLQQLRPDALIVYNILHSDRIPNFLEKRSGFYLIFFLRYRYSKRIFET